jgi:hypothetical protein
MRPAGLALLLVLFIAGAASAEEPGSTCMSPGRDGWDGFGFHAVWGNVPAFIRSVDVERLRRDVDMP